MSVKAMTMKQYNQALDNAFCRAVFYDAMSEFDRNYEAHFVDRLRSCQAVVYETKNYYILKSYETFVACIRKDDNVIIDVLRDVYGYTSTSAQHVSKFIHDYTPYPWNSKRYTWRDLEKVK